MKMRLDTKQIEATRAENSSSLDLCSWIQKRS